MIKWIMAAGSGTFFDLRRSVLIRSLLLQVLTQRSPNTTMSRRSKSHGRSKAPSSLRFAGALQILVVVLLVIVAPARAQTITELQSGFEHPPDDARIMMRWWWFGPSVTKTEIEREM